MCRYSSSCRATFKHHINIVPLATRGRLNHRRSVPYVGSRTLHRPEMSSPIAESYRAGLPTPQSFVAWPRRRIHLDSSLDLSDAASECLVYLTKRPPYRSLRYDLDKSAAPCC